MGYVTGTDSRQMDPGVWRIDDEAAMASPVRFIQVFVGSLDLEAPGFERIVAAPAGRPPYNPRDLAKPHLFPANRNYFKETLIK